LCPGESLGQFAAPTCGRHSTEGSLKTSADLRLQASGFVALLPLFHLPQGFLDDFASGRIPTAGHLLRHVTVEVSGESDFHIGNLSLVAAKVKTGFRDREWRASAKH